MSGIHVARIILSGEIGIQSTAQDLVNNEIRLPVRSFKPTKDQRQAINRWNRFVEGNTYINQAAQMHPKAKE